MDELKAIVLSSELAKPLFVNMAAEYHIGMLSSKPLEVKEDTSVDLRMVREILGEYGVGRSRLAKFSNGS